MEFSVGKVRRRLTLGSRKEKNSDFEQEKPGEYRYKERKNEGKDWYLEKGK